MGKDGGETKKYYKRVRKDKEKGREIEERKR